ncbi:PEGA domain-containing protein [Salinispira pacifica]
MSRHRLHLSTVAVLVLSIGAAALCGCTTESGTLFASIVSGLHKPSEDSEKPDRQTPRREEPEVSSHDERGANDERISIRETSNSMPRLDISTWPGGADIYVNGRLLGPSPVSVADDAGRSYSVRISKAGYHTFQHLFYVGPNRSVQVTVELARFDGAGGSDGPGGSEGSAPAPSDNWINAEFLLPIPFREILCGYPGLAYAPLPDVLPARLAQLGIQFLGHVGENDSGHAVGLFPVAAGLRYGLTPVLELFGSAQGMMVVDTNAQSPQSETYFADLSLSLGIKWQYLNISFGGGRASGALAVRGTVLSAAAYDSLTNFDGLGISVPFGVRFGPLGIVLAPEVVASTYPVAPVSGPSAFGLYLWGYGRAALYLESGHLLFGLSSVLRTRPLLSPAGTVVPYSGFFHFPFEVGADFHLLIPTTTVIAGVTAAAEIESPTSYYVMLGAGLAFMF